MFTTFKWKQSVFDLRLRLPSLGLRLLSLGPRLEYYRRCVCWLPCANMEYSGSTQHQHFHLSLKAHLGQCIQGPVPVVVIVLTEVLIGREGEGGRKRRGGEGGTEIERERKGREDEGGKGRGRRKRRERNRKGYLLGCRFLLYTKEASCSVCACIHTLLQALMEFHIFLSIPNPMLFLPAFQIPTVA